MAAFRAVTIAFLIGISFPATGQTQAQQDRLNRVAQFVVTAPICEKLGMKLDPELPTKVETALSAETSSWQIDPAIVERLKREAITRQGRIFSVDLQTASDGAKTDAQLRAVKDILLGYGETCMAAKTDPIFSPLVIPPPRYDLATAANILADSMLEAGGLASWQTPRIQARGDLMMLAGSCRSKIGAARSDELVKQYGQSDSPRVRNYYARAFDEGLADPTIIETLAGCNRAIAANIAKAK